MLQGAPTREGGGEVQGEGAAEEGAALRRECGRRPGGGEAR